MNALQIFQQNFNIRPEPVPAEDIGDDKTVEVQEVPVPAPEIPAPKPKPEPETPVPEPEPEPEIPAPKPELEPEPEIPTPEPEPEPEPEIPTPKPEPEPEPEPEIPAPKPEPEPEPEIPEPEPEPEIPVPVPEIPQPDPKTSTVVTKITLNTTVVPEVAKAVNEIRRVQRRSSKLAIFRFWSSSQRSKTIAPVPVPAPVPIPVPVLVPVPAPVPVPVPAPTTLKPVVPEIPYIDGLKVISLIPAIYNLQPLRLRLLLQTPRNLPEKNFIIEVDPAAPLWVFDINLKLLSLPDWPADLHFNHLRITEMLRKSHMKRVYGNLNGSTPRQILLRNYDSLTFY